MVVSVLLLLFGVPVIVGLTLLAVRRARALSRRIAEVREEMARSPQSPYAALAELMQGQDDDSRQTPPRVWPPAPNVSTLPRRGKDGHPHG